VKVPAAVLSICLSDKRWGSTIGVNVEHLSGSDILINKVDGKEGGIGAIVSNRDVSPYT
jgi:hypothetical protein